MTNYIVKNGDEYFPEEHQTEPANMVLERPYSNNSTEKYCLVKFPLDFTWKGESLSIVFKKVVIDSCETESIQQVCDYLNKYNKYSRDAIIGCYNRAQKKTKTKLEEEIESLKQEKKELENNVSIYKEIKQKHQEMIELLGQLEDKSDN